MANPKDFSARQIRASQLIASGGITGTNAGLIIYSASIASDLAGGHTKDANLLSNVGTDVYVFVSGSKDSKVARGDAGNGEQGVTLFGGDVVFSGTMYADKMVVEVDMATTGSLLVSGSLFVSRSLNVRQGATFNSEYGQAASDTFTVGGSSQYKNLIEAIPFRHVVRILSGGAATSTDEIQGTDVAFFVSGSTNNKDSALHAGTALFGGDLHVSGNITATGASGEWEDEGSILRPRDGVAESVGIGGIGSTISGYDIYLASDGGAIFNNQKSAVDFRVASDNKTNAILVEGTNDQVLILSGGGVTSYNEAAAADVAFYVSGSAGSHGSLTRGVAVLGGDVVVSGSIFAKDSVNSIFVSQYIKHDGDNDTSIRFQDDQIGIEAGGENFVTIVEQTLLAGGSSIVINEFASDNIDFRVESDVIPGMIITDADTDQLILHSSGTSSSTAGSVVGTDVSIYLSGSKASAGSANSKGTAVVTGDLVVSGTIYARDSNTSISVSEYIKHLDDTDTRIRFQDDRVRIDAGGTGFLDMTEDGSNSYFSINPLSSDVDFYVATTNKTHAIFTNAGNDQVLILSGGGPTSTNEGTYTDMALFVSGTIGSKDSSVRGTSVFGGDVVISGTLYGGSPLSIGQGLIVNESGGTNHFRVETNNKTHAIFTNGISDQVLILSGGGATSPDEQNASDTVFFVSGSPGSRGTSVRGLALFGGDLVTSGTITSLGISGGAITGSITRTALGKSYIVGGTNVTVSSASNGQITLSATGGVDGSGASTRVAFWSDADTLTSDADMTFDGDTLSVKGLVVNELGIDSDFRVESDQLTGMIISDASTNQLILHSSGTDASTAGSVVGTDVAIYLSGSKASAGTANTKGATVATGDLVVSGTIFAKDANTSISVSEYIKHTGDTDTYIRFTDDDIELVAGGVSGIKIDEGGVAPGTSEVSINDGAVAALDFRVATSGATHALFIDSGGNSVAINGTNDDVTTTIANTNDVAITVDATGVVLNEDGHASIDFRVETDNKENAIFVDAGNDQVLILSGGGATSANEASGADLAFFVSGSIDSKGTTTKGTSVFGGDLVVSGTIFSGYALGGAITGSLTRTATGASYLVGGTNVTISSASNGQVTISSTAGGTVDGSGAANRVAFWLDSDTLTSDADLNFNGSNLGLTGSATGAVSAFDIDRNYAGTTSNSAIGSAAGASGILLDYDVTGLVAASQVQKHKPLWVKYDSSVPSHHSSAIIQGAGIEIEMTGSDSGISHTVDGININVINSDGTFSNNATRGIMITAPAGTVEGEVNASHIRCLSQVDTGDYFDISVGTHGITQLTTKDAAAANGHLNLKPDGKVLILSGGGATSSDEATYADTNFFVSGAIGSKDSSVKGTSVFGGDLYVSGTIFSGFALGGAITGSLTRTATGESYLVAGSSVTISSASNGQITISSTATSAEWTDEGDILRPADGIAESVGIGGTTNSSTEYDIYLGADATAYFNQKQLNGPGDSFRVSTSGRLGAIEAIYATDTVYILSGGGATSPNPSGFTDTGLFISGAISSRGTGVKGTSVFGGDLVVSGNVWVEQDVDVNGGDLTVTAANDANAALNLKADNSDDNGDHWLVAAVASDQTLQFANDIGGSPATHLTITPNATIGNSYVTPAGKLAIPEYIEHDGDSDTRIRFTDDRIRLDAGSIGMLDMREDSSQDYITFNYAQSDVDFQVATSNKSHGLFINAGNDQVLVLSGGHATDANEAAYTDLGFFVSGSIGTRGTTIRGTSVFGGDLYVSGTIFSGFELGGAITGSLTRTATGESYLVGGTNVTISSASNGQVTISATAGGTVDGSGAANRVAFWSDADTLTSDADFTFDGTDLTLATANRTGIFVDGSEDQILILSGGGATSTDEAGYSDTAFFVSGALNSRGTSVRGTSVFGGDLAVSGTLSVNRGQSGAGSVVTITDDGKVGIGTDSPSYKLEVGGNMAVGEYIYHRADTDTFIRFQDDSIKVNAGNVDMISITEDGSQDKIVLNEGGADVDFRVESSDREYGLFLDAANNQVLVLSGGGPTSSNEGAYTDLAFFVSGSRITKGSTTKGVALFGGDLVTSGAFYAHDEVFVSGVIKALNDIDTKITFTDDAITFTAGNENLLTITESGQDIVTIGDGGDVDFQVKTNGDDNTLFVQGSSDRVGIGTDGPSTTLHISDATPTIRIQRESNSNDSTLEWAGQAGVKANAVHLGTKNDLVFSTWNTDASAVQESLRFNSDNQRQVIFLSGANVGPTSMQPGASADINFFVSGSTGSVKTSTRGTGVFGGDVVVSGSLHVENSFVGAYISQDGDFTVGTTHHIVGVDTTSGVVTASLPAASLGPAGRMLIFKDVGGNAGTNNIVIDPDGTEKIDGVLQAKITSNSGSMSIFSSGLAWHIYGVS